MILYIRNVTNLWYFLTNVLTGSTHVIGNKSDISFKTIVVCSTMSFGWQEQAQEPLDFIRALKWYLVCVICTFNIIQFFGGSTSTKPGVMYMFMGIDFACFCDFLIGFWNCSESVFYFILYLNSDCTHIKDVQNVISFKLKKSMGGTYICR